jgi:hypothetical protein
VVSVRNFSSIWSQLATCDRVDCCSPVTPLLSGHRALVLAFLNRPDEAIVAAHQAMRLSPRDPGMFAFFQALAIAHLAAGRYEEGLLWAEEGLRENGGMPALRLKLSLCGHLGQQEAAHECLRQLKEIHSKPTIAGIVRDLPKRLAPEIVTNLVEGLRKAGVSDR